MEKDHGLDFEQDLGSEEGIDAAPRARNKTVLLTPEITTQVRARIAHESDRGAGGQEAGMAVPDGSYGAGGFVPVGRRGAPEPVGAGAPRPAAGYKPAEPAHIPQPAIGQLTSDAIVWGKVSPVIGFLVSFDRDQNGEFYVLRSGRLVITSQEPPGGSYLFLKDDSVSPMHAIMRVSESGEIQVLDQLSEFGTIVKRFGSDEEVKLSGDKCSLDHGDVIKFGNRAFNVCVLAKAQ